MSQLLKRVECPVCFNVLQSPVKQCNNGHVICKDCQTSVRNCPVCKEQFSLGKTKVFEDLLDILPHKCKHKDCPNFVEMGEDHEKWCGFQLTNCRYCDWKGCTKDIFHHVTNTHDKVHLMIENNLKMSINVSNKFKTTDCIMPMFAYGQFLWMERKFCESSELCTTKFYLVPNGKLDNFFEIQVTLENAQNTYEISTRLLNECILKTEDTHNSFSLHTSVLQQFLNKDSKKIPYKLVVRKL